jgi:hypothetical protein
MIADDEELKGTRARIAYFEDLLAQMRVAARPELFPSMASGYRAEIEKMQREDLEYLTRHARQPTQAEAALTSATGAKAI